MYRNRYIQQHATNRYMQYVATMCTHQTKNKQYCTFLETTLISLMCEKALALGSGIPALLFGLAITCFSPARQYIMKRHFITTKGQMVFRPISTVSAKQNQKTASKPTNYVSCLEIVPYIRAMFLYYSIWFHVILQILITLDQGWKYLFLLKSILFHKIGAFYSINLSNWIILSDILSLLINTYI